MNEPWLFDVDAVAKEWAVDVSFGLSDDQAQDRLRQYGPNQLEEKNDRPAWKIFIEQFQDFIVWVLVGAAVVSGLMGEWVDTLAIVAIVVVNAVHGFIQEHRAEQSLAALRRLSSPSSKVVRNGQRKLISSTEVVPGDLIELEAGDHVPADCRLIWLTPQFGVQEASLTGESTPVDKHIRALDKKDIPLADRTNMAYMGTSVVSGKGRALVCGTGARTELGKIAGMLQTVGREDTPLQRKLEEFGRWIVYVCFVLVALVFVMNILRSKEVMDLIREGRFLEALKSKDIVETFLTSVSLAVAAIPEGLPAVVTVALALGVQRMLKRHVLIRKLPAVETLGCATVICSDKTGTLTRNEMTVQALYADAQVFSVTGIGYEPKGQICLDGRGVDVTKHPGLGKVLTCGVLCNGADLVVKEGRATIVGDPTEGALLTAAGKAGLFKKDLEARHTFVEELPFDSDRKRMTILRKQADQITAYVKGAPDILLSLCTAVDEGGQVRPLREEDRRQILKVNADLADRAMRVLAVAWRKVLPVQGRFDVATVEKDLVFAGLAGMIDPPREEVKVAMAECMQAGIRPVMITGDHKNTAVAVARQLGFFQAGTLALTGQELDAIPDDRFATEVEKVGVYARVSPENKLRIVKAWRHRRQVVAMTGDGVNDAPAVKEADIGVAMGITGTDVTKEVSDMVITDDNFASIVAAVKEGRGIYDNIQKFIHYLLSCNTGEILVMFIASLLGLPAPLLAIHILWVNLVTDGLPALALGVEPVETTVMQRPPRDPRRAMLSKTRVLLMIVQGTFIAACSLTAFWFVRDYEQEGLNRARTAAFVVLSCSQLFHAFNCRNMTRSLFRIGLFTNPKLLMAFGVSFGLQMVVVYVPFLQTVFKTEALGLFDWVMIMGLSSLPLWAMEVLKALNAKWRFLSDLD